MNYKDSIVIILLHIFISVNIYAQVGIGTDNPKEKLDIEGNVRIRDLPLNNSGLIYEGETTKSKQFLAINTVVSDENGNIGIVKGLPPLYKRNTVKIDNNVKNTSETSLGNLKVRYVGSNPREEGTVQFSFAGDSGASYATIWGEKMGTGFNRSEWARSKYQFITFNSGQWVDSETKPYPKNKDMTRFTVNFLNTNEIYRVSILCNDYIASSGSLNSLPARVSIFIEKLE